MLDITAYINKKGTLVSSYQHKQVAEALRSFAESKCRILIEPTTRTLDQNSYIHAIFSNIAVFMYEAGIRCPQGDKIAAETWKIYYKKKYGLSKVVTLPDGEIETVIISTAKYNKKQMTDFIEQIRHDDLIIESGHYILTPKEFKEGKR